MTHDTDQQTLRSIIADAEKELEEWHKDNPDEDMDEMIHDIADGAVPVYTYDLIQLAAHDISLATDVPEIGPAFDGSPTPINIIAANVYEAVTNALYMKQREIGGS